MIFTKALVHWDSVTGLVEKDLYQRAMQIWKQIRTEPSILLVKFFLLFLYVVDRWEFMGKSNEIINDICIIVIFFPST